MPSPSPLPVRLLRAALGSGLCLAAVSWLFHTEAGGTRVLVTLAGRSLTRLDLAAVPLVASGGLLVVLALVGRRRVQARVATVWLVLAGLVGWAAVWWLSANPLGEGEVLARVDRRHGLTQSDVLALPLLAVAGICAVAGGVELVRSARRGDPAEPPGRPREVSARGGS